MTTYSINFQGEDLTSEEINFRKELFANDIEKVLHMRLHCTVCLKDVKETAVQKKKIFIHPLFRVLLCKDCLKFYGDGIFSVDEDGTEKYCRWCGQGGNIFMCSSCPVSVCKACVTRSLPRSERYSVERDDWVCFACNPKPLYTLRAHAWALNIIRQSLKKKRKSNIIEDKDVDSNSYEGQINTAISYMMNVLAKLRTSCRSLDSKLMHTSRKFKETKTKSGVEELMVSFREITTSQLNHLTEVNKQISDFNTEWSDRMVDLVPAEVGDSERNGVAKSDSENCTLSDNSNCVSVKRQSNKRKSKLKVVEETEESNESTNNTSKPVSIEEEKGNNVENGENSNDKENEVESPLSPDEAVVNGERKDDQETPDQASEVDNTKKISLRIRGVSEINDMVSTVPDILSSNNEKEHKTNLESDVPQESIKEVPTREKEARKTSSKPEVLTNKNKKQNTEEIKPIVVDETSSDDSDSSDTGTKESNSSSSDESVKLMGKKPTRKNITEKKNKNRIVRKELPKRKVSNKTNKITSYLVKEDNEDNIKHLIESSDGLFSSDSNDNSSLSDFGKKKEKKRVRGVKRKKRESKLKKRSAGLLEDFDLHSWKKLSLSEIKRRTKSKFLSQLESSSDDTEKKKVKESKKKRGKEASLEDMVDEDSCDSAKDVTISPLNISDLSNMPDGFNDALEELNFLSSEIKKEFLASQSDGSLMSDSDEEKNKRNKKHSLKKKEIVDSQFSSDSDLPSKKKKGGSCSLLTAKIISATSSDRDDVKATEENFKKNSRKKKKTVRSDSDDDIFKQKKTRVVEFSLSSSSEDDVTPKKRKRIRGGMSGSSDDSDKNDGTPGKHRKNIRKVLKEDKLKETTQNALKLEEERKKRIRERQRLYNELMSDISKLPSNAKLDKLVLEFDIEEKKELVCVDKDLVAKLKPHQAEGVKFMWDCCFETLKKTKKSKGSGCILAHCMGLGKTLQVITLTHTVLMNESLALKTALILCPLSTVLNWVNEFEKWLSDVGSGQDINVFHITKVLASVRAQQLRDWQRRGGVMIMGYNLFRILVNSPKKVKAVYRDAFLQTLTDPGPDFVICDEGHILKNEATAISKSVSKMKTPRRIVLTGTPLQNNLVEYHCMVQFVKPNLLGTKKEFTNRFVNPIQNGQFVDSTPHDVKVMKRRAHVLHNMLDGIVQRKDYNVLTPFLPTKHEYVLSLSLTELQVKLYQEYLQNHSRQSSESGKIKGATLFSDRHILGLICAHPRLLKVHAETVIAARLARDDDEDEEGSLKDFIDDSTSSSSSSSSSSGSDSDSSSVKAPKKRAPQTRSRANENDEVEEEGAEETVPIEEIPEVLEDDPKWWQNIVSDDDLDDITKGVKMNLLFNILAKCGEIGDKVLVFSQSLLSLDLIEYFLDKMDNSSNSEYNDANISLISSWTKGLDYFRLDGRTSSDLRTHWCNQFNSLDNDRARLFLISTRAGGLGINLTGANRVIIFDASWNPSHDIQSIFRIYRFGQTKPCYVYRFLSKGTMEQKVYDRQVTKQSMSCRVIDEQQIDRHFSFTDLNELYSFTPNEVDDKTPPLPKDRLLAELLQEHKGVILTYHSHDSLLENQENEELTEEERKAAWADFEAEKKPVQSLNVDYFNVYNRAYFLIKQQNPTWTDQQLREAAKDVLEKGGMLGAMNMVGGKPGMPSPNMAFNQQLMQQQQRLMMMAQQQAMQRNLMRMPIQQMPTFINNQMTTPFNQNSLTPNILPNPAALYSTMQSNPISRLPLAGPSNTGVIRNPFFSSKKPTDPKEVAQTKKK